MHCGEGLISTAITTCFLSWFLNYCCVFEWPNFPSDFMVVDIGVIIHKCWTCRRMVKKGVSINFDETWYVALGLQPIIVCSSDDP